MFNKFKAMVLDALAESQARHEVSQEKYKDYFKKETPEETQAKLKEINDMMRQTPEQIMKAVQRINDGLDPTHDQIMNQKRQADNEAIILKKGQIKEEIAGFSEKDKNAIVLGVVAEELKNKAIKSISNIRDKATDLKDGLKNKFTA